MRSRSALLALPLAALVLAACGSLPAPDPSQPSANDRKLQVFRGTAPGIVLIPGSDAPAATPAPAASPTATVAPAAPGAPATPANAATGWGAAPAAATAAPGGSAAPAAPATPPRTTPVFGKIGPPTGLPPTTIKNLERKDLGIPLPSSLSASQPAK